MVDNSNRPKLVLIDGQQRLATISVLFCVMRALAQQNGDNQLHQALSDDYLGSLNRRTRKTDPKLSLNENNDEFYQENILGNKSAKQLQDLLKKRTLVKSNRLLTQAYLLLREKVQERINNLGEFAEALIELEECVRDKFITILISVEDLGNAYLIFETLNDRGLELSVSDLLKNYIFSRAEGRLDDVKKKWSETNGALGKLDVTKFIRHYWLSNYGVVREKDLYRAVSSKVKSSSSVFSLVKQLHNAAEIYGAFEDSENPLWDTYSSELKDDIERLALFKVSQCHPVLLAAKETLSDGMFPAILRMMVVLSFRYSIIGGFGPGNLERVYSTTARDIRARKLKNPKAIFGVLSKLYPADTVFKQYFVEKTIRNAQLARYILREINNHLGGGQELITNPNEEKVNLEHILPRNPTPAWLQHFSGADPAEYVYRVGDMTLLDSNVNRRAGTGSFQEKRTKVFSKSQLEITKALTSQTTWGPLEIGKRQAEFARSACQV